MGPSLCNHTILMKEIAVKRYLTIFMILALSTLLGGCMPMMKHAHVMIEHLKMHHAWMMDHDHMMDHGGMMGHKGMMDPNDMDPKGMDHEGMMGQQGMDHGAMANGTIPEGAPFDAQFIDSMIQHHEGAVAMAKEVLTASERPELVAMAEAIIAAQTKEIAQLQEWRATWYADLPLSKGMGMAMGQMMMPADETTPFDQRFLTTMIDHHQGAIHMAEMALEQAEHAEIKTLSKGIIAAQQAEITQLQGWLQDWFDVKSK